MTHCGQHCILCHISNDFQLLGVFQTLLPVLTRLPGLLGKSAPRSQRL
jgi:hypothetical protein